MQIEVTTSDILQSFARALTGSGVVVRVACRQRDVNPTQWGNENALIDGGALEIGGRCYPLPMDVRLMVMGRTAFRPFTVKIDVGGDWLRVGDVWFHDTLQAVRYGEYPGAAPVARYMGGLERAAETATREAWQCVRRVDEARALAEGDDASAAGWRKEAARREAEADAAWREAECAEQARQDAAWRMKGLLESPVTQAW